MDCQVSLARAILGLMGNVIVFANTKGGVGKSTLAVHLAVWLHDGGYSVSLLDADDQGTAATWIGKVEPEISVHTLKRSDETARADELRKTINKLRSSHEFVVVDTKGVAGLVTSAALVKADLALVPLQPSAADLWAIDNALSIIRLAQEVRDGKPEAKFILNQTTHNDAVAKDLRRLARSKRIAFAACAIKRLNAYRDAPGNRTTATRLKDRRGQEAGTALEDVFVEVLGPYLPKRMEPAANE